MTAPKNAILPGQNWVFCPSPVQKVSQNCRPTSSNFGCFESLIFTKFLASQDRLLFSIFSPLFQIFFGSTTFSSPDVCPTFRARRSVPDVCPTSPDVWPTSARGLPVSQKHPSGWHSRFFCDFFLENKKTQPPKKT